VRFWDFPSKRRETRPSFVVDDHKFLLAFPHLSLYESRTYLLSALAAEPGPPEYMSRQTMHPMTSPRNQETFGGKHAMRMAARAIGLLWALISWPVVVLLAFFEPFVRGILYGFALLGALAALFLRFVGNRTDVPVFTVFAVCIGCMIAAGVYTGLLRFLAGTHDVGR
jgi:hypothetical protein